MRLPTLPDPLEALLVSATSWDHSAQVPKLAGMNGDILGSGSEDTDPPAHVVDSPLSASASRFIYLLIRAHPLSLDMLHPLHPHGVLGSSRSE